MDPTDILVESLIKAASTEAVKRGLDAISTRVRAVFDRGSRDEIKKVIEEDNLASPLAALAKESLDSSYVIPFSAPNEARPTHKVDFFFHVLQYGFKLSSENKMDILVPGSFAGVGHLSLFSTAKSIPALNREALHISFPEIPQNGYYAIIPSGEKSTQMFEDYKDSVVSIRNESERYIQSANFLADSNWTYSLARLSAGTAYFTFFSLVRQKLLDSGTQPGSNGLALTSWSEGIKSMLRHAADYPSLGILPTDEVLQLIALAEELRNRATPA